MNIDPRLVAQQKKIIDSNAKITIVKAGPGSGKTFTLISFLERVLPLIPPDNRGVAVLSFTNVAKNEIANRCNSDLRFPHFVGTIDSFLLKYVIIPFGHLVGINRNGARLIPDEIAKKMPSPVALVGSSNSDRVSIFTCTFTGGNEILPEITVLVGYTKKVITSPMYVNNILREKKKVWQQGFISHADTHYLAAKILKEIAVAPKIVNLISKKFSWMLVDEFQDTSWFSGRALKSIFEHINIRSFVVGDPDQAIYEFGGASPSLFNDIANAQGANTFPISISNRCTRKICEVASLLSDTGQTIGVAAGKSVGKTILIVHSFSDPQINVNLAQILIENTVGSKKAILARKGTTVEKLTGSSEIFFYPGKWRTIQLLGNALSFFSKGESQKAYQIVSKILCQIAFDREYFDRRVITESLINIKNWKVEIFRIIRALSEVKVDESWNQWTIRAKSEFRSSIEMLGKQVNVGRLGDVFKMDNNDCSGLRILEEPQPGLPGGIFKSEVSTIHKVKGQEFETVLYFVPKEKQASNCISNQWFISGEERRIAYVGATRAKECFILCVHLETFKRLQQLQPKFLALFEVQHLQ